MESEETHLRCAICEERKEKRFCPAVHGKICPQCCGEQREVTLDCPSDCPYLQQAREHATEQNERAGPRDLEALVPEVEIPEQFLYEREELILGLSFALAKSARGDRSLMDRDLIVAVGSLAKSHPTLVKSSLLYGHAPANLAPHASSRESQRFVTEGRQAPAG